MGGIWPIPCNWALLRLQPPSHWKVGMPQGHVYNCGTHLERCLNFWRHHKIWPLGMLRHEGQVYLFASMYRRPGILKMKVGFTHWLPWRKAMVDPGFWWCLDPRPTFRVSQWICLASIWAPPGVEFDDSIRKWFPNYHPIDGILSPWQHTQWRNTEHKELYLTRDKSEWNIY